MRNMPQNKNQADKYHNERLLKKSTGNLQSYNINIKKLTITEISIKK